MEIRADRSFLDSPDQRAKAAERAARFASEQQKPPPPLPTNRITISSGKVKKNDSKACLIRLKERLDAQGLALNADQERAMRAAGLLDDCFVPRYFPTHPFLPYVRAHSSHISPLSSFFLRRLEPAARRR